MRARVASHERQWGGHELTGQITWNVRECIAQKEKTHELTDAIARGHATYGMQTFDQSLTAIFREDLITYEEALAQATNPDDSALKVRGIASTSDARWDQFDKSTDRAENGQAAAFKIDRF